MKPGFESAGPWLPGYYYQQPYYNYGYGNGYNGGSTVVVNNNNNNNNG